MKAKLCRLVSLYVSHSLFSSWWMHWLVKPQKFQIRCNNDIRSNIWGRTTYNSTCLPGLHFGRMLKSWMMIEWYMTSIERYNQAHYNSYKNSEETLTDSSHLESWPHGNSGCCRKKTRVMSAQEGKTHTPKRNPRIIESKNKQAWIFRRTFGFCSCSSAYGRAHMLYRNSCFSWSILEQMELLSTTSSNNIIFKICRKLWLFPQESWHLINSHFQSLVHWKPLSDVSQKDKYLA